MIIRPHKSSLQLLFVWHGSILRRILPQLGIVFVISVFCVLATPWWAHLFPGEVLNLQPFTLMGLALAIFLGFRNSVSYSRFWEARQHWGSLLINARSLTRQVLSLVSPLHADCRRHMVNGQIAFAHSLRHQLRNDDAQPDLDRLLPAEVAERIGRARFKPAMLLLWLGETASQAHRHGWISDLQLQSMDRSLSTLSEVVGACERIAGTPIPYTYHVLLNRTVMVYCLLLPMALSSSIGWLTPLISTFIAYTFFGLDEIGEEIADPFGVQPNDLALGAICHTIETTLREMLDDGDALPLEPEPRHFVLH